MVIEGRHGADGVRDLHLFIAKAGVELAAVDADQAYVARAAFRADGKGRHPAGLNFGDCFAYAFGENIGRTAAVQGTDFSSTDVVPASY